MNTKIKTITITAVATTVGWALLLTGLFFWPSRTPNSDERLLMDFHKLTGALGGIAIPNSKNGPITVVIEELRINSGTPERVELAQRQMDPQQRILIGVRELPAASKRSL